MTRNIGILGTGIVGKTLALGFLKHGYNVMIGSRKPDKINEWIASEGKGIEAGNLENTANFGEIIILAINGKHAKQALETAGEENLNGKTIIDATNPIEDSSIDNGVLRFFTDINRSFMEELQEVYPEAHFVKAFNSVGAHLMVNPDFDLHQPSLFICGNNEQAKKETQLILELFGWDVEDMGAVEAARAIEPLCMLWCIPGFINNEWVHAFKLLKR